MTPPWNNLISNQRSREQVHERNEDLKRSEPELGYSKVSCLDANLGRTKGIEVDPGEFTFHRFDGTIDTSPTSLPLSSTTVHLWTRQYLAPEHRLDLEPFFDPGRANPLFRTPLEYEFLALRKSLQAETSTRRSSRFTQPWISFTTQEKHNPVQEALSFREEREVLVIHYTSTSSPPPHRSLINIHPYCQPGQGDAELQAFVERVSYCRSIPSLEARACCLAAEVSLRLGGKGEVKSDVFDEEAEAHVLALRAYGSGGNEDTSARRLRRVCVPLGLLRLGLCRHRTLLFKLLCDIFSIPCYLFRGVVREFSPEVTAPKSMGSTPFNQRHSWNLVYVRTNDASSTTIPKVGLEWRLVDLMLHGTTLHPLSSLPEEYHWEGQSFSVWCLAHLGCDPIASTTGGEETGQESPKHRKKRRKKVARDTQNRLSPPPRTISSSFPLILERPCGYGASGTVWKGSLNGFTVAVKTYPRVPLTQTPLWKEWLWLRKLRSCVHVLSPLGLDTQKGISRLLLEYRSQTLLWLLNIRREPLDPEIVLILLRGIASGLNALHRQGGVHRDVKAENILLEVSPTSHRLLDSLPQEGRCSVDYVQLCDFGDVCVEGQTQEEEEEKMRDVGHGDESSDASTEDGEDGFGAQTELKKKKSVSKNSFSKKNSSRERKKKVSRESARRPERSFPGTKPYMAPEIKYHVSFLSTHTISTKKSNLGITWRSAVDLYALGVLLCEVCNLELTLDETPVREKAISVSRKCSTRKKIASRKLHATRGYIARHAIYTLQDGRKKKIVVPQLRHPEKWPKIIVEIIQSCLELDPDKRITAREIVSRLSADGGGGGGPKANNARGKVLGSSYLVPRD